MKVKTIGFPKITNYGGDIRDFFPSLFAYFLKYNEVDVYLEEGYGSGFGLKKEDYLKVNPNLKFVTEEEIYRKELVIILKMPDLANLEKMPDESGLFTMAHFETRPKNVELYKRKSMRVFSMDGIVNDYGNRIFADFFGTAFNASKTAWKVFSEKMPNFWNQNRRAIGVTILGVGNVAQNAAKSFEILSDRDFLEKKIPGIIIKLLPRTITSHESLLSKELQETDILVDASKRWDTTQSIIPNDLLAELPEHAVILDITADYYEGDQVKGIEGTVTGTLEKRVIYPDDSLYDDLPKGVANRHRRVNISCNSWPGLEPKESILYYENLMKDYLNIFMSKDLDEITVMSDNSFERALSRSALNYFIEQEKK